MSIEIIHDFRDYIQEASVYYLNLVRGNNSQAFTRNRHLSVLDLIYQMLDRKGGTQWSDTMDFYQDLEKTQPVTETAFYLARKKFNPEAMRVMSNEFIGNTYDNKAEMFKTWKGNLVLAIDGSRIILPDTKENASLFGRINSSKKDSDRKLPSVGGLLSTLHDCLNDTFLDVEFGPCTSSEQGFACSHINTYCSNFSGKAIFTCDRGYPSMRLINQLINKEQFFLFRCASSFLKSYMNQVEVGEDKILDVVFDYKTTNHYRDDYQFREHLVNTQFKLRFTKVILGKDKDDQDIIELMISNLPIDEYPLEDIKELYHLRWTIETSYNRLKNRMKLEEFSGYKAVLIYQDIYADIWLYNLISLSIMEMNSQMPIEQQEEGEYGIKRNFNKAIGIMKRCFIRAVLHLDKDENSAMETLEENISSNVVWIKKNRSYSRNKTATPSAISYKKTY